LGQELDSSSESNWHSFVFSVYRVINWWIPAV